MKVFIVEAPYKTTTLRKELSGESGSGPGVVHTPFKVIATYGHLLDLPQNHSGFVDGKPVFYPVDDRRFVRFVEQIAEASQVYILTDPDREGEAIAHEIQSIALRFIPANKIYRLRPLALKAPEIAPLYEKTLRGHSAEFELDYNVVKAALTRRVIDRVIGYTYSQRCRVALKKAASIGRVKTAVLRYLAAEPLRPAWHISCAVALGFDGVAILQGTSRAELEGPIEGWGIFRKIERVGVGPASRPVNTARLMATFAAKGGVSAAISAYRSAQKLYQSGILSYPRTREDVYSPYAVEFAAKIPELHRQLHYQLHYQAQLPESGHEAIRPTEWDPEIEDETLRKVFETVKEAFVQTLQDRRMVYLDAWLQAGEESEPFTASFCSGDAVALETVPGSAAWLVCEPRHFNQRAADLFTWMDENRVGTPSTYASTITGLIEREYISPHTLTPSPDGYAIVEWTEENIPWLDAYLSIQLEQKLLGIEQGETSPSEAFGLMQEYDREPKNRAAYTSAQKTDIPAVVAERARHYSAAPSLSL